MPSLETEAFLGCSCSVVEPSLPEEVDDISRR